jgi:putative photosynthetic complex assembly protein 2
MSTVLTPILYALLLWWAATGVILFLNLRSRRTFPASMTAATGLLGLALLALWQGRNDASVFGSYQAFTAALIVWGWIEMTFLMGFITGPRRSALPSGATGLRRFAPAVQAILYHELVLIAAAGVIYLLAQGASNRLGLWTFLVLWVMRLSAKLNLFLGVRNLGLELLPQHMLYLGSYFRQRALNPLLPLSLALGTLGTAALAVLAQDASSAGATTGFTLLSALLGLATLEHLFLVLPMRSDGLWRWARGTT